MSRAKKLKAPQQRESKPPSTHKRGSESGYTAKEKKEKQYYAKEIQPFHVPEPNFHGAYCEFMQSSRTIFLHGPVGSDGPAYRELATPEELWDALLTLALEPGALDPAARMPKATEALYWSDRQMRELINQYTERKEINQCAQGPGLRKRKQKKFTLAELGLA